MPKPWTRIDTAMLIVWCLSAILTVFYLLNVGVSACDSTRIDTTWGELDSVRVDRCMDYTGFHNHVRIAQRGYSCGFEEGTAEQLQGHYCDCDCHWYDIWRKIEWIDTVEVPNEKDAVGWAPADTLPLSRRPDTACEYITVDTVERFYEWRQDDRGWWQREDNLHGWYTPAGYSHLAEVCPEYLSEVKDTTFDTIWLPKVQQWLTPEEEKTFKSWLSLQMPCGTHGHDWVQGVAWMGPDGGGSWYYCSKCPVEQAVRHGDTLRN